MIAVLDFFSDFFRQILVLEDLHMKMIVLEGYLELGKTVEICQRFSPKVLFFWVSSHQFQKFL